MIVSSWCPHKKQTVKDGEPYEYCDSCHGEKNPAFFVPNMTPFFNRGLGMVTYGTRDAEKKAKRLGLEPTGGVPIEKVFPKKDSKKEAEKMAVDLVKQFKAGKIKKGID